jgi:hypothetical protein
MDTSPVKLPSISSKNSSRHSSAKSEEDHFDDVGILPTIARSDGKGKFQKNMEMSITHR